MPANARRDLIRCLKININYLKNSSMKDLLNSLLASFNVYSTVNFPTRITNSSTTLIDNIIINTYRNEFTVHPLINRLSDNDAQILTLSNIFMSHLRQVPHLIRKINNHSIMNFTFLLSFENWEDFFFFANRC